MRCRISVPPAALVFAVLLGLCDIGAQERFRLAIIPFRAGPGLQESEAKLLTDMLVTRVANSWEFTLIDAADRFLPEEGLSQAVALGKELGVDYLLYGSAAERQGLLHTLRMLDVFVEELVVAEEVRIDPGELERESDRLARRVLSAAAGATRISIQDVDLYIRVGNYGAARRALDAYVRKNGEGAATKERDLVVNRELARRSADQARRFLRAYLFDEAERAAAAADRLDPRVPEYEALKEQIIIGREKQAGMELSALLEESERLLQEFNYPGAQALVKLYRERGGDDPGAGSIEAAIEAGFEEERVWADARRAVAVRDYARARTSVRRALELNPDNPDYTAFLRQIDAEEVRDVANREKWELYKSEIVNLDKFALFVEKKPTRNFELLSYARPVVRFRELETLHEYSEALSGVQGSLLWAALPPFPTPLSSADLHVLAAGGLTAAWGSEDSVDGVTITTDRGFYGEVHAAAAGALTFLAYQLGVAVHGSAAIVSVGQEVRTPSLGEKSSTRDGHFALGGGFGFWLSWMASERLVFTAGWRRSYLRTPGAEEIERLQVGTFTIGAGYKVFARP